MISATATIRNEAGIHCRPSAIIIKAVADFPGEVFLSAPKGTADCKSVLDLLSLELYAGVDVTISVESDESDVEAEKEMSAKLVELFEWQFDFPPREESERGDS